MSEELQSFKRQRQIRQQGAGNWEKGEKEESRAKTDQGKGAGGGEGPHEMPHRPGRKVRRLRAAPRASGSGLWTIFSHP